jgi:predicted acetyltransferase
VSELAVMDRGLGDLKVHWDQNNEYEVAAARLIFDDMKAKGYLAYKLDHEGANTGEVIRAFDPDAERIIMSPQPVGG